jgi:hypothetical protein
MSAEFKFAEQTDLIAADMSVRFDILMTGADPSITPAGCSLARRLLPRYLRMRRFAERCIYKDPNLQSDGYVQDLKRKIDVAQNYLAKGKCR